MEKQLPQPQQIDSLAQLYDEAQAKADEQQGIADIYADQLIEMVKQFGQAAPKSDKTKQIQGDQWIVKVTLGQTVKVIADQVTKLRVHLARAGKSAFFKLLYTTEPRYGLQNNAQRLMQGHLPFAARYGEKLRALFLKTVDIKANSPRLKVERLDKDKKKGKE